MEVINNNNYYNNKYLNIVDNHCIISALVKRIIRITNIPT